MLDVQRYRIAARAAGLHATYSLLVAAAAAWIVFGIWYVYPYSELAGGRELFLLLVVVDVVCGPLLTLVLFNPKKSRKELSLDLSFVLLLQLAALGYGMWTVWQARPLYLAFEVDRFKLISAVNVEVDELKLLPENLAPQFWSGPKIVGIRPPKNAEEHNTVLFEAAAGGRDYAERPRFYVPYGKETAVQLLKRVKPLSEFLLKRPNQLVAAQKLALERKADIIHWMYLPVIARQDWVAVLDKQGQIQGFLKGDGF